MCANTVRLCVLLAFALAPAGAEDQTGSRTRPPHTVRHVEMAVVMSFDAGPSPLAVESMRDELARLLGPGGLKFLWRVRDGAAVPGIQPWHPSEVYQRVVVAGFQGACTMRAGARPGRHGALGYSHVSGGQVIPFISVDCNRIRGIVGPRLSGQAVCQAEVSLGRAVARVLAHELYHVIAGTQEHGRVGASKASFSARELVQPALPFEGSAVRRIRESLFPLLARSGDQR